MDGHDLEMEKARLLSLALDFGFDEESAKKCLDRLVHLYGTHCHTNPRIFFSLILCLVAVKVWEKNETKSKKLACLRVWVEVLFRWISCNENLMIKFAVASCIFSEIKGSVSKGTYPKLVLWRFLVWVSK